MTISGLWKTLVDGDSCLAVIHQDIAVDYLFRCRKQLDRNCCNVRTVQRRVVDCSIDILLTVVHVVDSHGLDRPVGSCRFLHSGEFFGQLIVFILEFGEIGEMSCSSVVFSGRWSSRNRVDFSTSVRIFFSSSFKELILKSTVSSSMSLYILQSEIEILTIRQHNEC